MIRRVILAVVAITALVGCVGELDNGPRRTTTDQVSALCGSVERTFEPLHRLTATQYNNTVRDILGVTTSPASRLTMDEQEGYDIAHTMSAAVLDELLEANAKTARDADLTRALPCSAAQGETCARQFVTVTGRKIFRRPLLSAEVDQLMAVYQDARENGAQPFEDGIRVTIEAMLSSPAFLYHLASAPNERAGEDVQIKGFEAASRLSYLIWNSAPDDALLNAAEQGKLDSRTGIASEVQRMLADSRRVAGFEAFLHDWANTKRLAAATRVTTGTELRVEDLQQSLNAFIHYAAERGDMETLLSSNVVFMNRRMAQAMDASGVTGDDFVRVDRPATERSGILTQPGFMSMLAKTETSDPINRGLFVLRNVLCEEMSPPATPAPDLSPPSSSQTTRERFAQHTQNPACQGCHQVIDPIGFSFEAFDHLGRYRTQENGRQVRTDGNLPRPAEVAGALTGAQDLTSRIAQSSVANQCMARNVVRYALRRTARTADTCETHALGELLEQSQGNFVTFMASLAGSDLFLVRKVAPN